MRPQHGSSDEGQLGATVTMDAGEDPRKTKTKPRNKGGKQGTMADSAAEQEAEQSSFGRGTAAAAAGEGGPRRGESGVQAHAGGSLQFPRLQPCQPSMKLHREKEKKEKKTSTKIINFFL